MVCEVHPAFELRQLPINANALIGRPSWHGQSKTRIANSPAGRRKSFHLDLARSVVSAIKRQLSASLERKDRTTRFIGYVGILLRQTVDLWVVHVFERRVGFGSEVEVTNLRTPTYQVKCSGPERLLVVGTHRLFNIGRIGIS